MVSKHALNSHRIDFEGGIQTFVSWMWGYGDIWISGLFLYSVIGYIGDGGLII